jgi:hypothetical protein
MRIVCIVMAALSCAGCASVTRGWSEQISIASTPSGAVAEISGMEVPTSCTTPCAVSIKRNADISVSFTKAGYEPVIIPLTTEVPGTGAAGFAGNLLLGGVIGMGVDAVSGAALDHKPNPVIANMTPIAAPEPPPVQRRAPPRQREKPTS